jgi:Terminase small subunit
MLTPAQPDLFADVPPLRSRKRQAFCDVILDGKTGRDALAAAGSKAVGHSADVLASKWLNKVDVATHLAIRRRLAVETANISAAQVLREAARIAFSESAAFGEGLKLRVADKIAALRLLGEHLGLFKAAVGLDVSMDVNLGARLDAAMGRLSPVDQLAIADALEAFPVGPEGAVDGSLMAPARQAIDVR